jgi:DNA repair protein RadC
MLASPDPRYKIWNHPEMISFEELLAVLLSHGGRDRDVMQMSRDLAGLAGNESGLLEIDGDRLLTIPGIGRARASAVLAAAEIARRKDHQVIRQSEFFNPERTAEWLKQKLRGLGREFFYLLTYTKNYRLIHIHMMDKGNFSSTEINVRDLMGTLISDRAHLALIAHNHPQESAHPSSQDLTSLFRLDDLLESVDVYLIDQYIVGEDGVFSCRQNRHIIQ